MQKRQSVFRNFILFEHIHQLPVCGSKAAQEKLPEVIIKLIISCYSI